MRAGIDKEAIGSLEVGDVEGDGSDEGHGDVAAAMSRQRELATARGAEKARGSKLEASWRLALDMSKRAGPTAVRHAFRS